MVFMLGMWGGGLFHMVVGSIRYYERRYHWDFIHVNDWMFAVCRFAYGSVVIMYLHSSWYPGKVTLHTFRCWNSQKTTSCPCSYGQRLGDSMSSGGSCSKYLERQKKGNP